MTLVNFDEHEQIILSMLSLDGQHWTNVLHSSHRPELMPWPSCLGAMGWHPLGQISSESHGDLAPGSFISAPQAGSKRGS